MEGIPPEDLKNHERQKSGGNKSESDDDEPSNKKNRLEQPGMAQMPPQMMMQNMVPQFPMMMPRKFSFK